MNKSWFEDVLDFHEKFDTDIGEEPYVPSPSIKRLRMRLIKEETKELGQAFQKKNIAEVADALADLIYVSIGTAVACGIDLRPIWDEVHRSNMDKVGGGKREDGKILKPEGWVPPDIESILKKQLPLK